MTTPGDWLANEIKEAETAFEDAQIQEELTGFLFEETMNRKYWEGYLDATINAYAGVFGPTPLESEEN